MDIEKLDKYLRSKPGVTVGVFLDTKRYLLCDRMFARLSYTKDSRPVLSVKSRPGRLEFWRNEYPDVIVPCKETEPLHWNSVPLGGGVPDDVVFAVADESYNIFFTDLPEHTKRFMDDNEPSYKYVMEKFDFKKSQ